MNRLSSDATEYVVGVDFGTLSGRAVVVRVRDGEELADAVRWLRGEFTTKTEARASLGVRTIIDDDQIYDHLKLFARFVRLAGFRQLETLVHGDLDRAGAARLIMNRDPDRASALWTLSEQLIAPIA